MDYSFSDSPLMQLLSNGKHYHLPKKQVLNLSDGRMTLSYVKKGYIKRYLITSDGTHSVQAIYGPGDIFPLTPIFKLFFDKDIYRGEEVFYYETMTEAHVNAISTNDLLAKISSDPTLYKDLLYVAGMRLGANILRLENVALKSASQRVAHRLLYYCDKFGQKTDEGVVLNMPLTHQALADILNLARETVSSILSRFQEKGVIKSGTPLLFPDIEKLRRETR